MSRFRLVPDTNVVIASRKASATRGPNRELMELFLQGEFTLLYSSDTLREYARKLLEFGIGGQDIAGLLSDMAALGEKIEIQRFHLRHYPEDVDDICFLLCAVNGAATHLVTYDKHLLVLDAEYEFTVCEPLQVLRDLREQDADAP